MNKTLMTDFYELTMCQAYFESNKQNDIVYFDVFFRNNPFNGGYAIMGGLEEIIDYILNFKFTKEDIKFLRNQNIFTDKFLNYLKNLKFKGDVYSVIDGTPIFPNEPIITIKCDIIMAQLLETAILASFNHRSLVTTATRRLVNEAKDIPIMEFGARRARGVDSAIEASKYAFVGGCIGTSNTLAGKKYNIPVMGTMAHSFITEYDNEYEAFLAYAKMFPNNTILLVDTYDTLRSGIPNAIKVAKNYLIPNGYRLKGIRIDSGDLAYLSKEARKLLDKHNMEDVKICLSNGLNEHSIADLIRQGAVIDSIGAGDNIAASKERMNGVYKLVAKESEGKVIPKIKVSNDAIKITNPGYKKLYRFYDKKTNYALGDLIALYNEKIPNDKYTLVDPLENWKKTELINYTVKELQVPIFINGELVYKVPSLNERQKYCKNQINTLYPEITRINKPHGYYVDLSIELLNLKNKLIVNTRNNGE